MSDIIIPITPDSSAPPSQPLRGVTRMVKLIQTMVGWRWCIWISPYTFKAKSNQAKWGHVAA